MPSKYRLESCRVQLFACILHVGMQLPSHCGAVVFLLRSDKLDLMSLVSLISSWSVVVDPQIVPEGLCLDCAFAGSFWAAKLHKCRGFPVCGHTRHVLCGLVVRHGMHYCSSHQAKQERKCITLAVCAPGIHQTRADGPQRVGASGKFIEMSEA